MVDGASNRTGSVLAIASLVGAFAACGSRSSLGPGDSASGGAGGATDSASGGASTTSTTTGVTGGAGGAGSAECHPGDPPVLLANSGFEQRALVLDADFVYFAPVHQEACVSDVTIRRVPKAGGSAQTLWTPVWPISALAIDEGRVYWVDDPISPCTQPADPGYLLHAAPKGGGEAVVFPPGGGTSPAVSLATNGAHVYWSDNPMVSASIYRAPKGGGSPELVSSDSAGWSTLVADEAHLYVVGEKRVFEIDTATLKPMTLVDSAPLGGFLGAAMDAEHVYFGAWIDCQGAPCKIVGSIQSIPKGEPGVPTTLASEFDHQPLALAEDDAHVYWTQAYVGDEAPQNGQVLRIGKDGSGELVIAEAGFPISVAVDGTCVYWADGHDGTIWKAPK